MRPNLSKMATGRAILKDAGKNGQSGELCRCASGVATHGCWCRAGNKEGGMEGGAAPVPLDTVMETWYHLK